MFWIDWEKNVGFPQTEFIKSIEYLSSSKLMALQNDRSKAKLQATDCKVGLCIQIRDEIFQRRSRQ